MWTRTNPNLSTCGCAHKCPINWEQSLVGFHFKKSFRSLGHCKQNCALLCFGCFTATQLFYFFFFLQPNQLTVAGRKTLNPFYNDFQSFKMCFGSALEWKQNLLNFFVLWSHVKTIFAWEDSELPSVMQTGKAALALLLGVRCSLELWK